MNTKYRMSYTKEKTNESELLTTLIDKESFSEATIMKIKTRPLWKRFFIDCFCKNKLTNKEN